MRTPLLQLLHQLLHHRPQHQHSCRCSLTLARLRLHCLQDQNRSCRCC